MKKKIFIAMVTLIALALFAGWAWGCPGCGYHSGQDWRGGSAYSGNQSPQYQEFKNETAPLREKLASKQEKYNTLMTQGNPDPKQATQLQQKITRLQEQILSKARSYNMPHSSRAHNYGAHWNNRNHGGWCW